MARASVGTYTPAYDSPATKKSLAASFGNFSKKNRSSAASDVAAVLLSVFEHAPPFFCASQ